MSVFSVGNLPFTFTFYEFQCLFCKSTSVLTFIIGIFYFILAWRGLKTLKLKKMKLFLPTSDKSAIKNNPLMQLGSIFRNKLTVLKFQSHTLNSFSAFKKTITGVEGGEEGVKLFLFL